jgi:hypothetical protein
MTAARAVPSGGQLVCNTGVVVLPGIGLDVPPEVVGLPQAANNKVKNRSRLIKTKRCRRGENIPFFIISCLLSHITITPL